LHAILCCVVHARLHPRSLFFSTTVDRYVLARPTPNHPEAARISSMLRAQADMMHKHTELVDDVVRRHPVSTLVHKHHVPHVLLWNCLLACLQQRIEQYLPPLNTHVHTHPPPTTITPIPPHHHHHTYTHAHSCARTLYFTCHLLIRTVNTPLRLPFYCSVRARGGGAPGAAVRLPRRATRSVLAEGTREELLWHNDSHRQARRAVA